LRPGRLSRNAVLLAFDPFIDFFAMHRNVLGCVDPNPDLITFHAQHGDGDFITDHERFPNSARQYQHIKLLLLFHQ